MELWDVYDKNRNITGRTHERGLPLAEGDYHLVVMDGESLDEVQERNIAALKRVIKENKGKNVAIGTHGMALSTILNYYDPEFGYDEYWRIVPLLPYIIQLIFIDSVCVGKREFVI